MDPGTWVTIAAFLFLTFADQAMTALWAWRLGPDRAKKLTIAAFKDPVTAREVREALQLPTGTDLLAVRHDMESVRSAMEARYSHLEKHVTEALKSIKLPDFSPNMQLPVTALDAIQRDIRAAAKQELRAVLQGEVQEMLTEAIKKAMAEQSGPQSMEEAQKLAEELELRAAIDAVAQQAGLPPWAVTAARKMGRLGLAWLDERFQLGLAEAMQQQAVMR